MPGPLRKLLLGISRVLSRGFVRPEADRLLKLLSDPIIESTAYTNRTLRDLETRLPPPSANLLAMQAFRALGALPQGSPVLVAGPMPALLAEALAAGGYAVTAVNHDDYGALADGTFAALLYSSLMRS